MQSTERTLAETLAHMLIACYLTGRSQGKMCWHELSRALPRHTMRYSPGRCCCTLAHVKLALLVFWLACFAMWLGTVSVSLCNSSSNICSDEVRSRLRQSLASRVLY